MKLKLLIGLFFATSVFAQVGIVKVGHPVYRFLSRMENLHIINNYDEFQLPKTRKQISKLLTIIEKNRSALNATDKYILNDFLIEFEFDLKNTSKNYSSFFNSSLNYSLFNENERFTYFYINKDFNLFSNISLNNNFLYEIPEDNKETRNVYLIKYGGELRVSFLNNLGFSIYGSNGTFFGSKQLAQTYGSLKYNFKFNYDKLDEGGVDFFDETEGYFLGDWDIFNVKIGRDRINLGYGQLKTLIGNNAPSFDYISMNLNYHIFNFSYFHGKILGNQTRFSDPQQGLINSITDKYLAYHRVGFDFGKHFSINFGEMIIYSNRSIDFSYLNPFNYYKSVEHANQDRDNSMLFLDFENNSFNQIKFFGTLLIDDVDFGKLGTSFFGNQALLELGFKAIPFYQKIPIEFEFQYIRIDPYVYTHRIHDNNYTHNGFGLSDIYNPNSEIFSIAFKYPITHRIMTDASFNYTTHGANISDINGNVIKNVGGDINLGHREQDSDKASFLDGQKVYIKRMNLGILYEPFNNYYIGLNITYLNSTSKDSNNRNNFLTNAYFTIKL
jgi:hypothetical protein